MMALTVGIVVGFIAATVCYHFDIPKPKVEGKLVLDISNPDEVVYQLTIYDRSGKEIKDMKQVLVDVEVGKVERGEKNETDSN